MSTVSSGTVEKMKETGTVAASAEYGEIPTRSKKLEYKRSGTRLSRYRVSSVIQAKSSINATPGSETL